MELLEPNKASTAGRYEHKVWGGIPAATRNRFGKGHAWYLGTHLNKSELKDFLKPICETAGLPLPPFRFPIVCRRAVSEKKERLMFLMNFSGETQKLHCPVSGLDIHTNGFYAKGGELLLHAWDLMILREEGV